MASFTRQQWEQVFDQLGDREAQYGLPLRRDGSLVLSSFNIRKFGALMRAGKTKRSQGSWQLLVRFCERCDFVAIQEVLDDLSSLFYLREQLGDQYGLVISDVAGGVPGRQGNRERLAFLYRKDRIRHTELSSDISFERSVILETLFQDRELFAESFEVRVQELLAWEGKVAAAVEARKRKPRKPPFVIPKFVQFIRTPHLASFEAEGEGDADAYRFLAVNAHLLYGHQSKQREERWMEFKALLDWLLMRARELDRVFQPNIFLFGDLNLDFKKVDIRRRAVEQFIKSVNEKGRTGKAKINMPFLDAHPSKDGEVFRTNARRDQTYDQIALIARDKRLPPPHKNDNAGNEGPDLFDYGMFDFVQLFLDAVPEATKSNGKPDYTLFEYDVSDHMPIWIRLQKPIADQARFRWR
ncbi:endonuclease/exonuclease/phosphatase family protein [Roseibacillus persicicus]|uniref:endonuclease/exonuclease/phosphatase n=1 Tax=Roseibacillus persicicus TaxID=454148 RepID=UPI00398B0F88